ncbi:MAG: hypothetical protein FIA95_16695, partial [Gemmatimonadetes bacterium]|nr:hypothetical protein [Gemmatimonadota bacterium]
MASRVARLLSELKRRKVYGVATAYLVVGTVVIGAANDVLPALGLPAWTVTLVVVLVLLGFPVALVLAWAYEVRPEEQAHAESLAPSSSSATPPAAQDKSIVVLPFDNFSPDPADAYLADGVTEEITADLSGLRSLRVISRTSATQYKGSQKDIPSIGRELSVRYVLEGSVRKSGDELKITCQLIDAADDSHLWAKKYAGTIADIFDLQERVARSIVDALAIQVSASEQRSLAERRIPDLGAYELYLRARQGMLLFTKQGLEDAQRHLEQALEGTGENAFLLGQLAQVHYQFWNYGIRIDEEDLRLARELADRATALDPSSADHHFLRGLLEQTGGSAARALGYMQTAVDLDPAHADALAWCAGTAALLGLEEGANEKLERLRRIDPLNPFCSVLPVWIHLFRGRHAAGLELAERTRALRPPEIMLEMAYESALALNGRVREAAEAIRRTHHPEDGVLARQLLALAYAYEHDREGAGRMLDRDVQRWAEMDFNYSLWMAEILAQIGDSDRALH